MLTALYTCYPPGPQADKQGMLSGTGCVLGFIQDMLIRDIVAADNGRCTPMIETCITLNNLQLGSMEHWRLPKLSDPKTNL